MLRIFACVFAVVMPAVPAVAGNVAIHVVDETGQPVSDVVITVHPAAGIPAGPIRFPWANTMLQKNIAFNPGTLIVPVGATVNFPNQDKVRHHVYSFSKPAKFELKLFGKDESRSYKFKTAGAVALGCNIHDSMAGFIKVVDTPFANKSNGNGDTQIAGVTGGKIRLTAWHPKMKAKDNEVSFTLDMPTNGDLTKRLKIALR